MKVTAYEVSQYLKDYSPTLLVNKANIRLLDCEILSNIYMPPRKETIYICSEPEDILTLPINQTYTILCCFPEYEMYDYPELLGVKETFNFIILSTYVNEKEMYAKVRSLLEGFQTLAHFSSDLFCLINENASLQNLTDLLFSYVNNSVYVIDAGFQVLAMTEGENCHSPQLKEIDGKYYLDDMEMKNVNYKHHHEQLKANRRPLLIQNEYLGPDRILCMIDNDRDIGHVVLVEDGQSFDSLTYDYINEFRHAMRLYFSKDSFVKNVKGFNYEYFLRDLLAQKYVASSDHGHRIKYIDKAFSANMFCIVVETGKTLGGIHFANTRSFFESVLDHSVSIVYESQIIIILTGYPEFRVSRKIINQLREYIKGNGLYCGMSNAFDNILCLYHYYKQALRALELGTNLNDDPGLFIYEDYYMEHIVSVFQSIEDPDIYCHPYIKCLMQYDEENSTELAKTLYYYLVCGNTNDTAASLYVHRNTVLYRINIINDMLGNDFKDVSIRRYLMMSYEMIKRRITKDI